MGLFFKVEHFYRNVAALQQIEEMPQRNYVMIKKTGIHKLEPIQSDMNKELRSLSLN